MSEGQLYIKDSRTWKDYIIPISKNAILAADINKINAPTGFSDAADKVDKGLRVLDPGFNHTASHESKITWVDGDKGQLLFRGHNFNQLGDCEFESMLHLLVWGSLPDAEKQEVLRAQIADFACSVSESVYNTIRSFPKDSPAVPMVLAGLAAYAASEPTLMPAYNAGQTFHNNEEMIELGIITTVAVYSVVVGIAFCHRQGLEFTPPSRSATFWENFLVMVGMFDKLHYETVRRTGSMAADHELSNSTFALLVTASSLADPVSCLMSAICSAYGPLHMGACESAYKIMQRAGGPHNAQAIIDAVKTSGGRLFGYGHRIYRVEDPRIRHIKACLEELLVAAPERILALETAMEVERLAGQDEYFVSRNLHVNADMYCIFFGIAFGFPADFIPVMLMCMRLPGYMGHWREAMQRPMKLMRPAGFYTGPTEPVTAVATEAEQAVLALDKSDSKMTTPEFDECADTPVNELTHDSLEDGLMKMADILLENNNMLIQE